MPAADLRLALHPERSHRERLLAATAEAIREGGFPGTTVADVVRRARTSRRTFYQHFDDLQECYLALFDAFNEHLLTAIFDAATGEGPWTERIDRTLGTYMGVMAAEPELTRSYLQDAASLGDAGATHMLRAVDQAARQLSRLVDEAAAHDPGLVPLSYDAAIVLIGGLRHLVMVAVADGRDLDDLVEVCADIVRRLTLA